ncbi:hypothetical protein JNL27_11905 [bacterium]|nr:hypothetical protein [bacterium]
MKHIIWILSLAAFISCGTKKTEPKKEESQKLTEIKITPGERTDEKETPTVKITYPKNGEIIKDKRLGVKLDVTGYDLGKQTETVRAKEIANSSQGQHIHIILDNKAYEACYEVGKPFEIPGELSPGVHTLRVFPSRSYHESLKGAQGWDAITFYAEKKEGDAPVDFKKPLLTYSRPKGTYKGVEGKSIMVDFWVSGCALSSDGYKVKLTINGQHETMFTEWKPYFVTGLSPGKYTFALELVDKDGKPAEGSYNKTEREITIE